MPDEIKNFGYRPDYCPKCGSNDANWNVQYRAAGFSSRTYTLEHLEVRCGDCGYNFRTRTYDARIEEKPR
jgi:predicted nucleic-acid-binding Zn-ribbon protein